MPPGEVRMRKKGRDTEAQWTGKGRRGDRLKMARPALKTKGQPRMYGLGKDPDTILFVHLLLLCKHGEHQ